MSYTSDYPAAKTQAQLDALTPVTVYSFRVGLQYQVAEKIGQTNTGTDEAPVFEERFILRPKNVTELNINQCLFELQNDIARGNAYSPVFVGTTTVPATTTLP